MPAWLGTMWWRQQRRGEHPEVARELELARLEAANIHGSQQTQGFASRAIGAQDIVLKLLYVYVKSVFLLAAVRVFKDSHPDDRTACQRAEAA